MSEASIEHLLEVCRGGSPPERLDAIQALRERGAEAATPALIDLLASPDSTVRETAASALGELGRRDPARAGAALAAMLSDPDELCRSAAIEALGALSHAPALDAIAERLRGDPAPVVRASAAEVLGDFADSRARAALEAALADPDFAVRAYAAASLALCCGPEILPVLDARFAAETSPDVQAEIVGARYRLGAAGALAAMLVLLDAAGDDFGTRMLNVVEDLAARRPPPSISADAGALHSAISRLAQRSPIQRGHAQRIAALLAEVAHRPELAALAAS